MKSTPPSEIQTWFSPFEKKALTLCRVIAEHKERYIIQSEEKVFSAEITGNMRYSATGRRDFPTVGDWVAASVLDDEFSIIMAIAPRLSALERKALSRSADVQLIAANVDIAFIIQAINNNFNLNRLDRYVAICRESTIKPVIVFSKIDLVQQSEIDDVITQTKNRFFNLPLILLSNTTKTGIESIVQIMEPGKTYCLLGSSGVGKSTLMNVLLGEEVLKTSEISTATGKGKHTTSHRELFTLPNGSHLIDTPGMRELGMADQSEGIDSTFESISQLITACKYSNCSHETEDGCAIQSALAEGLISTDEWRNYQKLKREQERFTQTIREKRAKDKQRGKLYKQIMASKKWKRK